ncbi:MAG: hypothetical protein EP332_10920 [Bacteroidetes bacterium]|nr:MAG: hypothetical protein EP332_10920 [Bacteroidota bacterium]
MKHLLLVGAILCTLQAAQAQNSSHSQRSLELSFGPNRFLRTTYDLPDGRIFTNRNWGFNLNYSKQLGRSHFWLGANLYWGTLTRSIDVIPNRNNPQREILPDQFRISLSQDYVSFMPSITYKKTIRKNWEFEAGISSGIIFQSKPFSFLGDGGISYKSYHGAMMPSISTTHYLNPTARLHNYTRFHVGISRKFGTHHRLGLNLDFSTSISRSSFGSIVQGKSPLMFMPVSTVVRVNEDQYQYNLGLLPRMFSLKLKYTYVW